MPAPGALNLGEWGRDTVVYIFGICVYLGWVCSVGYFLLGSFMVWQPISAESETEIKFVFPHLFCDTYRYIHYVTYSEKKRTTKKNFSNNGND